MLSIIAAIADNNVIGKDNKMIWYLPAELKRFKRLTLGHNIIMGRRTFESLSGILPDRKHIILTGDKRYIGNDENVEIVNNIAELDKYIDSKGEIFVVGGAGIYKQLMPKVNKMYITRIYEKFEGDAYFPEIKEEEWKIVEKVKGVKDETNPYDYEFITYVRK